MLALTIKNDLVGACAGPRQRKGRVWVFDPTEMTEYGNCTWSPLSGCQDFDRAIKVADWMIQGVLAKSGQVGGDMKDTHFKEAALRLLAVAIYIAACQGASMADAAAWIDLPSGQELGTRLQKVRGRDPRSVQWLASVLDRGPDERGSCFGTAQMMLRVYIEREVAEATRSSTFRPADLLDGGDHSLFVVAPKHDQRRLASLFTGIVMAVLEEASAMAERNPTGRLAKPLLVVLDELANTAPIDQLPQYLSTARSEGIVFIAIFQDLSQAEGRYGSMAGTILNNAKAKLFLSSLSDPKTLELLSKLLGQHPTRRISRDHEGRPSSTDDRQELMPLSAGRLIPDGRAVLIYANLPPAMVRLRYWFQDKKLSALVLNNPVVRGVLSVAREA